MYRCACRFGIGIAFLLAFLSPSWGQDNRQFFKKPETVPEFWRAVQLELNLGKFDLAADFLDGLVAKNPSDEELFQLEEKYGVSSFLKLLTVPKWVDDPKVNADIKKKARELVQRVGGIVQKHLADPGRIEKFIKNLGAGAEERAYAIGELKRSGPAAVPLLIRALQSSADDKDDEAQAQILLALDKLGKDTLPPLYAALDIGDPNLRAELIGVLRRRGDVGAAPHLWYLAGSDKQPPSVRDKAKALLAEILGVDPDRLPTPKAALVQEAEKYYQHRIPFLNPLAVTVWRWDGKELVSQTVPEGKAEEYFGLRFARQALDIDPTYQPAQVIFLSVALDKGFARAGIDQPLAGGAPDVKELLSTTNPDVVYAVLQRALKERRVPVILGAVRTLGDLQDVRAATSVGHGPSALVQALNFPDRRVQMAAAEALLKIPAMSSPAVPARIVEVLRRNIASDSQARAIEADFSEDRGNAVASAVRQAGFDTVVVRTGREVLRRLNQAADVDVVLLQADLPDPGLPNLLAQLRADRNYGRLPVLILAPSDKIDYWERYAEGLPNVWVIQGTSDPGTLKTVLAQRVADAAGAPLSEAERKAFAADAMTWLKKLAVGEIPGYNVRPADRDIREAMLGSDELALKGAIEAVGRLPSREAQSNLATVVLSNRPAEVRSKAATELVRHIQERGLLLTHQQRQTLDNSLPTIQDAKLKADVALVIGSMRPDAEITGKRLERFTPPAAAAPAPAPAPAKEEKKDEEKKEEKKEEK